MHDLATIDRLNAESSTAHEIRQHLAAGKIVVSEHTGLHLTGYKTFTDSEPARQYAGAAGVGVTRTVKFPSI